MDASFTEAGDDRKVLIADDDAAGRLDVWLAARLTGALSRSRVKALIEAGHVTMDGAEVREAKRKIVPGARITVLVPEPQDARPAGQAMALSILFEDDSLIVVDKPPGLVVHPGAGTPSGTLVNALIHHCGDTLSGIGGVRRPGIVIGSTRTPVA